MSQVTAAEGGDAALAGEFGDIGVQIHPVDALQFHHDVFFLELGEAVGYVHGEFRLGICSPVTGATAACRQYSGAFGCRAAQPDSSFARDRRSQKTLTRQGLRAARHLQAHQTSQDLPRLAGLRPCLVRCLCSPSLSPSLEENARRGFQELATLVFHPGLCPSQQRANAGASRRASASRSRP